MSSQTTRSNPFHQAPLPDSVAIIRFPPTDCGILCLLSAPKGYFKTLEPEAELFPQNERCCQMLSVRYPFWDHETTYLYTP